MSGIYIKKSKRGSLRKAMHAKEGQKLSVSEMEKRKKNAGPAMKKKLQFAINARKWKHEYGGLVDEMNIPQYSFGGILTDAVMGAGTGALTGGPIGALLGGFQGLIKGVTGEIQQDSIERQQKIKDDRLSAQANFDLMMNGNKKLNPFMPTFANGGLAGINAEIEKNEIALSPNGNLERYNLPSHSNVVGDNFKSFTPGTMIFSDKLEYTPGITFADQQNKYKKIIDKSDKVIKNNGSTLLQRKTAQKNKENYLKLSTDLFTKQEAMKYSRGSGIPKANGGLLAGFKKFNLGYNGFGSYGNDGGVTIGNFKLPSFNPEEQTLYQKLYSNVGLGNQPTKNNSITKQFQKENPINVNNTFDLFKPEYYGKPTLIGNKFRGGRLYANPKELAPVSPIIIPGNNSSKDEDGFDWQRFANAAAGLAPTLYNFGMGLFSKPEKISRNRYFNPYTSQIRSSMSNRRFNIDPILAANRNANAVYNRNVSNASGGDRSRLLSNLLAGMNARQSADATAYAQKINADNQYLADQAQMDFNLGNTNAQALAMTDDINARNLASKRNYLSAAMSGLQNYGLTNLQMSNQAAAQDAYLQALKSQPHMNNWLGLDEILADIAARANFKKS